MADAREQLIECFSAVFPDLEPGEIAIASPHSVASWDSLALVRLIAVVEETFEISVAAEDMETFLSFELFLDYLGSHADAA